MSKVTTYSDFKNIVSKDKTIKKFWEQLCAREVEDGGRKKPYTVQSFLTDVVDYNQIFGTIHGGKDKDNFMNVMIQAPKDKIAKMLRICCDWEKSDGIWTMSIKDNQFKDSTNVKTVELPEGTVSIGVGAFENSDIQELVDNNFTGCYLNTIKSQAFKNCTNLHTVDLSHSNISTIEEEAFSGCSNLKLVILPIYDEGSTIIKLEKDSFYGCPDDIVFLLGGTYNRAENGKIMVHESEQEFFKNHFLKEKPSAIKISDDEYDEV